MTTLRNLMREADSFSIIKKEELFSKSLLNHKTYGSNGEPSSSLVELSINNREDLQHYANTFEALVTEKSYNAFEKAVTVYT